MIRAIVVVLILVVPAVYYFAFHPPVVKKHATAAALQAFVDAVESKDRTKISQTLTRFLADDAKVRLEVSFFSITQQNPPVNVQEFDKPQFIAFIDNTLYPLTDYSYYAHLEQFALADDGQSAKVQFASKEWGDGSNYYAGVAVDTRFSSNSVCDGMVRFAGETVQLADTVCKTGFRSVPKPSEIGKMQGNIDVMKDYITKQ